MARSVATKSKAKVRPSRSLVESPPMPRPVRMERIGGVLIDVGDWPDHVIETIKKDYLLPPAMGRVFIMRVTLTASCPRRHVSRQNIGLMADTAELAKGMADGMPKARIVLNCPDCGKAANVTGKHIYWSGPMTEWDGAL